MAVLGDYIRIKHGFAFKGDFISPEDNGVVLVTPGNFAIGGGFKEEKCKFFHAEYPDEYVLKPGDLIVTMTDLSKQGDTLGYSAKVPESKRVYLHNQRIGLVDVFNPNADKDYLYWFMRSKNYQKTVVSTASGSTVKHTSPSRICEIELNLPSINVQEKIAAILSSFDSKIELNQKINKDLERQAEAIFQSWFTDGKEINGCLADICQYSNEKVAVSLLDLDSYYSTENMLPGKAGATQAAKLPTITQTTKCNAGDVLVSNIRPYFKKIVYCYADCGCSTDVLCFTPKQGTLSAYLFFTLYADGFFDFMVAGSKGTKMPRGDKQQIMMYPVYAPSDEELTRFNSIAQPILKQIQLNREENKRLIALRDMLLPKLMTGEIIL